MTTNTTTTVKTVQIQIKKDGTEISSAMYDAIESVEVELTLNMPGMFIIRLHDDDLTYETSFDLGNTVEISLPNPASQGTFLSLLVAEVTAIEPEFNEDTTVTQVIRGYHKGHRLARGTKLKSYLSVTDSDIVSTVATGAGLSAQKTATTVTHDYVLQPNISDLAFLQMLAERNGFELDFVGTNLHFRAPQTTSSVTLNWGVDLRQFMPRATTARQVNSVSVYGWDQKTKQKIVGVSSTSTTHAGVGGYTSWGGGTAQSKFGEAKITESRRQIANQSDAEKVAKGILDAINSNFIEADGIAFGNPNIKAGSVVTVQQVGTRFSGTYRVSTARHVYTQGTYDTYFSVEGLRPLTMTGVGHSTSIANPPTPNTSTWWGVYPAVVTAINTDTAKPIGVKVKLPWLGVDAQNQEIETHIARVVGTGAGASRGIEWFPEVNDEVLVAFENGNIERPFVLGGLWNNNDALPVAVSTMFTSGKVQVRSIKTRLGSEIKFTDADAGAKIEILSAGQKVKVVIDDAQGTVLIESQGKIDVKSTGGKITVDGSTGVDVLSAANIKIAGTGNVNVEATGILTLKGSMVKIN